MRIVYMGSPDFAVLPLQLLLLNKHTVAAVYTRPDKPAGRGREPAATPVKKAALSWNLPVIQVPGFKKVEAVEQMAGFRPEAIVVAAFGQILPQSILDIPCHGCINIHPSLLPKYRGPSPVASTILAGDEFAGVSVMRLDAGMDTGPVFSQAQIPVLPQDTTESLTYRLFQIGAWMVLEVLEELTWGRLLPEPQDPALATYTREIEREDGKIDWNMETLDIWRKVRAYHPWPGAYTSWQGKILKIIEAVPLTAVDPPGIGRVVSLMPLQGADQVSFGVGARNGILGVLKVQIEGKRAMSAADFIRGQRDFIGSVLG